MDDQVGGGQLLRLVHEHLRYVTTLLRNGRYDDSTGRRLHATAAELLRLAGFTAFDSGQHGLAQRYWIAGLRAAHTAGDRALGANIIGFMSCQAKDLDGSREALVLAGSARQGYPGASGKVTAILALRTAEAMANDQTATTAHRSSETQRAIDDAFTALDGDPPSLGHPAWAYWMTPAQAHAQAGYCHLTTGDFTKARGELRAALRLQGDDSSREGALRNVLLATTYLKQAHPDLDRTLTHAHSALNALTDHVDSPRCRGHLSRLAAGLRPYRTTGVQDFLDRHTSLTAAKH
jgi:tetratricopeptide (TPR) repeat protein